MYLQEATCRNGLCKNKRTHRHPQMIIKTIIKRESLKWLCTASSTKIKENPWKMFSKRRTSPLAGYVITLAQVLRITQVSVAENNTINTDNVPIFVRKCCCCCCFFFQQNSSIRINEKCRTRTGGKQEWTIYYEIHENRIYCIFRWKNRRSQRSTHSNYTRMIMWLRLKLTVN